MDNQNLPWLCNCSWAENRLQCRTYNPYSRQIFPTSILVENPMPESKVFGFGSKQGWLIAGYYDSHLAKWSIFLYNPNTKVFISLPGSINYKPCFATFSAINPDSGYFQIFIFFRDVANNYNCLYEYKLELDEDNEVHTYRIMSILGEREECVCRGMQFMNGLLFCLFDNGVVKRFSLQDRSWTSLDDKLVVGDNQVLWLAKGDGDLLVAVRKNFEGFNCSTFCFDWWDMRWIERDLPESSAVLISGDIATFVRPFDDNRVHFFRELVCEKEFLREDR